MSLKDYTNVHCIGIGGIGLSAIARYCKSSGAEVSGSDGGTSRITEDLQKEGITVYQGHAAENIKEGVDLVIYTIAVTDSNVELRTARARGITCMTYPEALGMLTKEYTTIAVCGTHGKTTTTAMVASMLTAAGKKPTVIVGSLLAEGGLNKARNSALSPDHPKDGLRTNFVKGDSEYMVVEACEYKRSFLNLHPSHILVTNIDEDHLDYYKDIHDIEDAFQEFADKLPESGSLITHANVLLNTVGKKVNADIFDTEKIELSVLGQHNKQNAQLALALAQVLELDEDKAREGLNAFTGTWRRLEYKGTQKGAIVYDDYGHHQTEIQATLQALREKYPGLNATGASVASPDRPKGGSRKFKLIVVFQPHLFSRTKLLLKEFSEAFTLADTICILPIYKAREVDDGTISSHDLVEITNNAMYMENFEEVKKYLDKNAHSGSVVLTIGAGDVYLLSDIFITEEQK